MRGSCSGGSIPVGGGCTAIATRQCLIPERVKSKIKWHDSLWPTVYCIHTPRDVIRLGLGAQATRKDVEAP